MNTPIDTQQGDSDLPPNIISDTKEWVIAIYEQYLDNTLSIDEIIDHANFSPMLDCIDFLIQNREKFHTWNNTLRYNVLDKKVGEERELKFQNDLRNMIQAITNTDILLANMNDSYFLPTVNDLLIAAHVNLDKLLKSVKKEESSDSYLKRLDFKKRIYNVLFGDQGRISDLLSSSSFQVTSTPYSGNFEIACFEIWRALLSVKDNLLALGIKFDSRLEYILLNGPAHEKSHQDAYLDFDPSLSEARRIILEQGMSGLGRYNTFPVWLRLVLQNGTICAGMAVDLPPFQGLIEELYVLLAPDEPSLGDVLLASKEILKKLSKTDSLHQYVLSYICDLCNKFEIFDFKEINEDLPSYLKKRMTQMYHGQDEGREFIFEVILYRLKSKGIPEASIASELVRIIKNDITPRENENGEPVRFRWYIKNK